MNDETKVAVEAAHARITAIEAKSGGEPDLRIGLWALQKIVDGESSRQAAAVVEARRIGAVTGCAYEGFGCFSEMPIDPPCDGCLRDKAFADRVAELEAHIARIREVNQGLDLLVGDFRDSSEKAETERTNLTDMVSKLAARVGVVEAERDALRARIAELEAQAMDLCMTIGKAREDNLALVADNEKLTAKIKDKG